LYKTTDRENYTKTKFEGFYEILDSYQELKKVPDNTRPNFHKHFIIELNKPVSYI
jgi:hypothetical protein